MADKAPKKLGRYEIVKELGKGAMGIVYEGRDPNIGRRVAIKTARRDVLEASGRADELMERFLREAQAAGSLNHPNIITIFDAAEEDEMAYIAMEFLDLGDLEEYMARNKHIDPEKTVEICAKLCEALAATHRQGIVHRDIKPANVMMLEGDDIKITDFGIAHVSDSNLTQEGSLIGTPHYMSPEQFQGLKLDGRSDLFAVAIIMYEMLTNEKPFTGEALSTVMTAVIKSTPIEPKELNISVDGPLSDVVMKAMSKKPNQRYQTGDQMAAALREALKPNPDPKITGLVDPGDDATVVTSAPADATLAGVAPSFVAPSAAGAGVSEDSGTDGGETGTVTTGAPAVSEGRAQAPPAEAPPVKGPASEIDLALAEPEERRSFLKGAILGGGAIVVILAILAVMMIPTGEPVAPAAPYFSEVKVLGYLFPTYESFDAWNYDWNDVPEIALPAEGASITLFEGDLKGTQLVVGFLDDKGKASIRVRDRPLSLGARLSLEGYMSDDGVVSALAEDDTGVIRMALFKSDQP